MDPSNGFFFNFFKYIVRLNSLQLKAKNFPYKIRKSLIKMYAYAYAYIFRERER